MIVQNFLYNGVEMQALYNIVWCMLCAFSRVLWHLLHLNNNLLMYFLSKLIALIMQKINMGLSELV